MKCAHAAQAHLFREPERFRDDETAFDNPAIASWKDLSAPIECVDLSRKCMVEIEASSPAAPLPNDHSSACSSDVEPAQALIETGRSRIQT